MHKLGNCLLVRKVPTQGKRCGRSSLHVEAFLNTRQVRSRCIATWAAALNDEKLVAKTVEEHPGGKVEDMWACFFKAMFLFQGWESDVERRKILFLSPL